MELRDATPGDGDAIRQVHKRSILELGPAGYDEEQVEACAAGCDTADYSKTIASDDIEMIVLEMDDAVVGFGSIKFEDNDEYEATIDTEVTGVYVHPSVHREGAGTRIYEELERRARASGADSIGLWASLNAVAFYEHHGFELVIEHTHEFSGHESTGVTGTVVEMKKEL